MNMNLPNPQTDNIEEHINNTLANLTAIRNAGASNDSRYFDLMNCFIDIVFDCIKAEITKEVGEEAVYSERFFLIFYNKMVEFGTVAMVRGAFDLESLGIFFQDFMENLEFLYPRDLYFELWQTFEYSLAEQIGIIREVCSDANLIRFHADALINKSRTQFEN